LLALFGAHHILHVSRVRVKILCQYSAERTEERAWKIIDMTGGTQCLQQVPFRYKRSTLTQVTMHSTSTWLLHVKFLLPLEQYIPVFCTHRFSIFKNLLLEPILKCFLCSKCVWEHVQFPIFFPSHNSVILRISGHGWQKWPEYITIQIPAKVTACKIKHMPQLLPVIDQ